MRTRMLTSTIAVLLAVAACSGGSTATRAPAGGAATAQPAATAEGGNGNNGGNAASVDCAALSEAGKQLLAVQFLAQLHSADTVDMVKTKKIGNFDPDTFLAAMQELHALDGHASVLGDPKAAIAVYEDAAQAAKTLFATDPVTQDAIDAYNEHVGTVGQFLGHQAAIAGAMDEAGC